MLIFSVLDGFLLHGPAGRHREAAGEQRGGHLHVRAEHHSPGSQVSIYQTTLSHE